MMPIPTCFEPRKRNFIKYAARMLYEARITHLFDGEEIYHEALIRLSHRPEEQWNDAYLRTTINNLIMDKIREHRNMIPIEDDLESPVEEPVDVQQSDNQKRLRMRFSSVLTDLETRFGSGPVSRIDYFAVILLDLRFVVHGEMRRTQQLRDAVGYQNAADIIEAVVPWTDAQAARSFREGWPVIGDIWGWLRDPIDQNVLMTADRFIEIFNREAGSQSQLNQNLWYAWVNRARRQTRDWELPEWFFRLITPGGGAP